MRCCTRSSSRTCSSSTSRYIYYIYICVCVCVCVCVKTKHLSTYIYVVCLCVCEISTSTCLYVDNPPRHTFPTNHNSWSSRRGRGGRPHHRRRPHTCWSPSPRSTWRSTSSLRGWRRRRSSRCVFCLGFFGCCCFVGGSFGAVRTMHTRVGGLR